MTNRPERYLIKGPKVIEGVKEKAPEDVKRTFHRITEALETGPYPDQIATATPARGFHQNHLYVVWHDNVAVMYLIMQDQPVVSLVAVHWNWADPESAGSVSTEKYTDWTPPGTA